MRLTHEKKDNLITQKMLSVTIDNYNDSYHSGIKATPNEMKGKVIQDELDHNRDVSGKVEAHFNIGDHAIVKVPKKIFQKGNQLWSKLVYKIIGFHGYKVELEYKTNK